MALSLGLALSAPSWAVAQDALPSKQELNPGRTAAAATRPARDLLGAVEPGPCPLRNSPLKVTLTSVEFRPVATDRPLAAPAAALAGTYAGLIGTEQPVSVLCDIRDRASQVYYQRGVFASVEIPEQRIVDGKLVLDVVEARIVSVRYQGDAGPSQPLVEGYLEHLRGLTPFDLNVAQRYLLLASDTPGVKLNVALRPSAEGRGAVDMVIRLSRDKVDGVVSAQNYGSKSIGREGFLARVDLNGFTPFGERTSLIAYTTPSDEQRVVQLIEEARFGTNGLMGTLSLAYAQTRPGDIFKTLDLRGESTVTSASLTYPLVRHRRRNLNLSGGLDLVDQKVDFGAGGSLTHDKLRVLFARLDGEWAPQRWAAREVRLSGATELRKGLSSLGASAPGDPLLSRTDGVADAWTVRVDARGAARLAGPFTGLIAGAYQYADKPLLAYEEFAVGNQTWVRGYDPAVTSGDRARALSLELSTHPLRVGTGINTWRPYGFYDVAKIKNLDVGGDSRTVASAGFGVRAQVLSTVRLDVAYAKPLDKPLATSPKKPGSRVLISLVATLF